MKPRPILSPKMSPNQSPVKPALVQMNYQLLSNENSLPPQALNCELFKLQQNYTKSMRMNNVGNINLNNNKYLLNRHLLSSQPSPNGHSHSNVRIQNEFSPKRNVINSFTAAEIMKRIVVPPIGGNASRMARASNSLFNVANDLYKHAAMSRGKVKSWTIVELTRKMAQLRLVGHKNDVWSQVC